MPALPVGLAIGIASAIWYGTITWLAYRVGSDWSALQDRIGGLSRTTAIVASVLVAIGLAIWFVRRKRGGDGE